MDNQNDVLAILLENSFEIEFNCNDFFNYACAHSLRVDIYDVKYIIVPMIKKFGQNGINASLAYIFNFEPIKPHLTEEFLKAIEHLKQLQPVVYSDLELSDNYEEEGCYRKLTKESSDEFWELLREQNGKI